MNVLGIDLAKLTFDATLLTDGSAQHYQSFSNTPEGFTQLQTWLSAHGVTQLILIVAAHEQRQPAQRVRNLIAVTRPLHHTRSTRSRRSDRYTGDQARALLPLRRRSC